MNIEVTYDSSVTGAPAAFTTAITYVVNLFDGLFTNPATINIDVGWGEINGIPLSSGDLGESEESAAPAYSYDTVKNAFITTANASGDLSQLAAASTLPTSDPTSGGTFDIGTADAKALGLIAGNSSAVDGYVGFSSSVSWSFIADATPAASAYYFIGTAEHEITEVMGRDSDLGGYFNYPNAYTLTDLFRYSASGVRDLSPGRRNSTAYFSIDNGVTNLGSWNNNAPNGDLGDWYPAGPAPGGNDAFNDYSNSGVVGALTTTDITLMNVLGWDTSIGATEVPNGVTGWVASGQTSSGFIVLSGGYMEVGSGGIAIATTLSGGAMYIDAGGTTSGTIIGAGGVQLVQTGALASGSLASGGGEVYVSAGGTASGTTLSAGGYDLVFGRAVSTTIKTGGLDHDYGVESGTVVSNGGVQLVEAGGLASGTVASGGGEVYVSSGATLSGAQLSGGYDVVFGLAVGTTIKSGGLDYDFGVESGVSIGSGTAQIVEAGGTASGSVISGSGEIYVVAGGVLSGTTVSSGGYDVVLGTTIATTIKSGGIGHDFGSASGTVVSSGGVEVLWSGGVASGSIVSGGGEVYIIAGGTLRGAQLSGGYDVLFGSAIGTTVKSGGLDFDFGAESGTVVSSGGLEVVEAGASASGSVIGTGGQLYVAAGGTASGTTLSGGIDTVGGTAISTTVNGGGVDYVIGGGLVSGATLNNGATQVIYAGGTALGDHANSGSFEYVTSGGIASGAIISGGTMEIESGGSIGAGPITFATSGGGTLRLDDAVHFGGLIAGFGLPDQLDLTDIAFISGTTTSSWTQLTSGANASGTLTISDGTSGTTAHLTLLGNYTSGNFHVTSDALGGTLVLDPPVGSAVEFDVTGWRQWRRDAARATHCRHRDLQRRSVSAARQRARHIAAHASRLQPARGQSAYVIAV